MTDRNTHELPFGCPAGHLYAGLEVQPVWMKSMRLRPETKLVYGHYVLPPKLAVAVAKRAQKEAQQQRPKPAAGRQELAPQLQQQPAQQLETPPSPRFTEVRDDEELEEGETPDDDMGDEAAAAEVAQMTNEEAAAMLE